MLELETLFFRLLTSPVGGGLTPETAMFFLDLFGCRSPLRPNRQSANRVRMSQKYTLTGGLTGDFTIDLDEMLRRTEGTSLIDRLDDKPWKRDGQRHQRHHENCSRRQHRRTWSLIAEASLPLWKDADDSGGAAPRQYENCASEACIISWVALELGPAYSAPRKLVTSSSITSPQTY